jgi:nicotinamide/nicotinate riboside kinase
MPHHHHPTTSPELQGSANKPYTLLLALSGPSCSGKTTLARLLRDTLAPHAFILHEDDFYKTDAEIPIKKVADGRELQDWDCLESLDLEGLKDMLEFIKACGRVKDGFESKEDKNAVGNVNVDMHVVEGWKSRFAKATKGLANGQARIAIIDGFLLFAEEMGNVRDLFDVRLLLQLDYDTVKRRREARMGYVTLEGFWEDPEGYVDLIVWPNYVKDHAFLFKDGDVDGELDLNICEQLNIMGMPKKAVEDMTMCFDWAASILMKSLESLIAG